VSLDRAAGLVEAFVESAPIEFAFLDRELRFVRVTSRMRLATRRRRQKARSRCRPGSALTRNPRHRTPTRTVKREPDQIQFGRGSRATRDQSEAGNRVAAPGSGGTPAGRDTTRRQRNGGL
jgi:hypothetical protein